MPNPTLTIAILVGLSIVGCFGSHSGDIDGDEQAGGAGDPSSSAFEVSDELGKGDSDFGVGSVTSAPNNGNASSSNGGASNGAAIPSVPEPELRVDLNFDLDDACHIAFGSTPQDDLAIPTGTFDIASDRTEIGECADNDYIMHLRMMFGPDGRDGVAAESATVLLTDLHGRALSFEINAGGLPNPFSQAIPWLAHIPTGVDRGYVVASIPSAYKAGLISFVGETIIAEIRVAGIIGPFATLQSFELEPFRYPINICDGCLTACDDGPAVQDGLECTYIPGQDGRYCYDSTAC